MRQKHICAACPPIGGKPRPFPQSHAEPRKRVIGRFEIKAKRLPSAGFVIDRPGRHIEPRLAETANRTRHMIG